MNRLVLISRYFLTLYLAIVVISLSACGDTKEDNANNDDAGQVDNGDLDSDDDSDSKDDNDNDFESDEDHDSNNDNDSDSDEDEGNSDEDISESDDDDGDSDEDNSESDQDDSESDKTEEDNESDDDESESEDVTDDTDDTEDEGTDTGTGNVSDSGGDDECPAECMVGCLQQNGILLDDYTCPNQGERCCELEPPSDGTAIETDTNTNATDETDDVTETDTGTGEDTSNNTGEYCPTNGDPCKILPFGNSITCGMDMDQGMGCYGAYRVELFRLAIQDSKNITFVGSSPSGLNGPDTVEGVPFPKDHEGESGITIGDLDARYVPGSMNTYTPHIILLHIGTNDMNGNPNGADGRLATLIDNIIQASPDALLVVAQIVPFNGNEVSFNQAIPAIVEQRAAEGKHITMVDMHTGFPSDGIGDGVHPNDTGYTYMGGVWYEAIKDYLL